MSIKSELEIEQNEIISLIEKDEKTYVEILDAFKDYFLKNMNEKNVFRRMVDKNIFQLFQFLKINVNENDLNKFRDFCRQFEIPIMCLHKKQKRKIDDLINTALKNKLDKVSQLYIILEGIAGYLQLRIFIFTNDTIKKVLDPMNPKIQQECKTSIPVSNDAPLKQLFLYIEPNIFKADSKEKEIVFDYYFINPKKANDSIQSLKFPFLKLHYYTDIQHMVVKPTTQTAIDKPELQKTKEEDKKQDEQQQPQKEKKNNEIDLHLGDILSIDLLTSSSEPSQNAIDYYVDNLIPEKNMVKLISIESMLQKKKKRNKGMQAGFFLNLNHPNLNIQRKYQPPVDKRGFISQRSLQPNDFFLLFYVDDDYLLNIWMKEEGKENFQIKNLFISAFIGRILTTDVKTDVVTFEPLHMPFGSQKQIQETFQTQNKHGSLSFCFQGIPNIVSFVKLPNKLKPPSFKQYAALMKKIKLNVSQEEDDEEIVQDFIDNIVITNPPIIQQPQPDTTQPITTTTTTTTTTSRPIIEPFVTTTPTQPIIPEAAIKIYWSNFQETKRLKYQAWDKTPFVNQENWNLFPFFLQYITRGQNTFFTQASNLFFFFYPSASTWIVPEIYSYNFPNVSNLTIDDFENANVTPNVKAMLKMILWNQYNPWLKASTFEDEKEKPEDFLNYIQAFNRSFGIFTPPNFPTLMGYVLMQNSPLTLLTYNQDKQDQENPPYEYTINESQQKNEKQIVDALKFLNDNINDRYKRKDDSILLSFNRGLRNDPLFVNTLHFYPLEVMQLNQLYSPFANIKDRTNIITIQETQETGFELGLEKYQNTKTIETEIDKMEKKNLPPTPSQDWLKIDESKIAEYNPFVPWKIEWKYSMTDLVPPEENCELGPIARPNENESLEDKMSRIALNRSILYFERLFSITVQPERFYWTLMKKENNFIPHFLSFFSFVHAMQLLGQHDITIFYNSHFQQISSCVQYEIQWVNQTTNRLQNFIFKVIKEEKKKENQIQSKLQIEPLPLQPKEINELYKETFVNMQSLHTYMKLPQVDIQEYSPNIVSSSFSFMYVLRQFKAFEALFSLLLLLKFLTMPSNSSSPSSSSPSNLLIDRVKMKEYKKDENEIETKIANMFELSFPSEENEKCKMKFRVVKIYESKEKMEHDNFADRSESRPIPWDSQFLSNPNQQIKLVTANDVAIVHIGSDHVELFKRNKDNLVWENTFNDIPSLSFFDHPEFFCNLNLKCGKQMFPGNNLQCSPIEELQKEILLQMFNQTILQHQNEIITKETNATNLVLNEHQQMEKDILKPQGLQLQNVQGNSLEQVQANIQQQQSSKFKELSLQQEQLKANIDALTIKVNALINLTKKRVQDIHKYSIFSFFCQDIQNHKLVSQFYATNQQLKDLYPYLNLPAIASSQEDATVSIVEKKLNIFLKENAHLNRDEFFFLIFSFCEINGLVLLNQDLPTNSTSTEITKEEKEKENQQVWLFQFENNKPLVPRSWYEIGKHIHKMKSGKITLDDYNKEKYQILKTFGKFDSNLGTIDKYTGRLLETLDYQVDTNFDDDDHVDPYFGNMPNVDYADLITSLNSPLRSIPKFQINKASQRLSFLYPLSSSMLTKEEKNNLEPMIRIVLQNVSNQIDSIYRKWIHEKKLRFDEKMFTYMFDLTMLIFVEEIKSEISELISKEEMIKHWEQQVIKSKSTQDSLIIESQFLILLTQSIFLLFCQMFHPSIDPENLQFDYTSFPFFLIQKQSEWIHINQISNFLDPVNNINKRENMDQRILSYFEQFNKKNKLLTINSFFNFFLSSSSSSFSSSFMKSPLWLFASINYYLSSKPLLSCLFEFCINKLIQIKNSKLLDATNESRKNALSTKSSAHLIHFRPNVENLIKHNFFIDYLQHKINQEPFLLYTQSSHIPFQQNACCETSLQSILLRYPESIHSFHLLFFKFISSQTSNSQKAKQQLISIFEKYIKKIMKRNVMHSISRPTFFYRNQTCLTSSIFSSFMSNHHFSAVTKNKFCLFVQNHEKHKSIYSQTKQTFNTIQNSSSSSSSSSSCIDGTKEEKECCDLFPHLLKAYVEKNKIIQTLPAQATRLNLKAADPRLITHVNMFLWETKDLRIFFSPDLQAVRENLEQSPVYPTNENNGLNKVWKFCSFLQKFQKETQNVLTQNYSKVMNEINQAFLKNWNNISQLILIPIQPQRQPPSQQQQTQQTKRPKVSLQRLQEYTNSLDTIRNLIYESAIFFYGTEENKKRISDLFDKNKITTISNHFNYSDSDMTRINHTIWFEFQKSLFEQTEQQSTIDSNFNQTQYDLVTKMKIDQNEIMLFVSDFLFDTVYEYDIYMRTFLVCMLEIFWTRMMIFILVKTRPTFIPVLVNTLFQRNQDYQMTTWPETTEQLENEVNKLLTKEKNKIMKDRQNVSDSRRDAEKDLRDSTQIRGNPNIYDKNEIVDYTGLSGLTSDQIEIDNEDYDIDFDEDDQDSS